MAAGPADVVLNVTESAGTSRFRVQGSSTLSGFVFVVTSPRWQRHQTPGALGWVGCWARCWLTVRPAILVSAQEPHISTLHPSFGPQGGGTLMSLYGTHLSAGSSWRVTINGSECLLDGQPRYGPAIIAAQQGLLAQVWALGCPCGPTAPSSSCAMSPARATGRSGAQLLLPPAWAQPLWPCGSMARSSWPHCPSSTVPTPPF